MLTEDPREQALTLETAESQSWLSIYRHCPEAFRKQYRLKCDETPRADVFLAPGIDVLAFNRVVLLGLKTTATVQDIESIKKRYLEDGVRRFFIQVSPAATPASLEDMLIEAGFRHHNNWVKWYMPLNQQWEEDRNITIVKVRLSMARAFGELVVHGFGFEPHLIVLASAGVGKPGWAQFVASVDGAPAGCAAGYIHNGVCALGWAATLPEYRNRGVQSSLIRHRLNKLRRAGCELAVLETAEDLPGRPSASYRNMARHGFHKAYIRKNYIYEAA